MSIANTHYLADGNRRWDKNFGTFPVFRISAYGKFLTTIIRHRPMFPMSSGTCPSEESFFNVSSSRNIMKQTFFLEYVPICDNYNLQILLQHKYKDDVNGEISGKGTAF